MASLTSLAADHNLKWSLEPSTSARGGNSMKLTLTLEAGRTCEKQFNTNVTNLDNMLAAALREHTPAHPARQAWLEAQGVYKVNLLLKSEDDFRCIGAPMHTALRKLCDSDSSVLTWNALHHLAARDLDGFWTVAANSVKRSFLSNKPLLRVVAINLRDALLAFLEGGDGLLSDDPKLDTTFRRSETELFALRTLTMGCRLTDIDEWMWGWLGYVVERAE